MVAHSRVLRRVASGVAFVLLMASGVGVLTWLRIWRAGRRARLQQADAIVVFGAALWPDGPSPTLRVRTLHAAELYRRGLAPRVVCSGAVGRAGSEPQAMAALLRAQGVPDEALILDEAGVTTRATLVSLAVLGGGAWRTILAVSSPFHVFRIGEEAARRGLAALPEPARRAVPTDRAPGLGLLAWDARQHAREVIAVWAYRLDAWLPAARRIGNGLAARWRSFAREADEVRDASNAITAAIRERRRPDEVPMAVLPRMVQPVEGRITGRFAMRDGRLHEGIDIAQRAGTPVAAALAGVVLLASELPGYGRVVVVDHGGDLATVYGHLERVDVVVDERVAPSAHLGTVGTSGRAFGAHLHFEVRLDGTAVDPTVFLG